MSSFDEESILRSLKLIAGATADLIDVLMPTVSRADERESEQGAPPAPSDDPTWREFLASHPELRPDPLEFTDDDLLRALDEAIRQQDNGVADSGDVAELLANGRIHHITCFPPPRGRHARACGCRLLDQDTRQVALRLRRLAGEGHVTALRPRHGGRTFWLLAGHESRVSDSIMRATAPRVLADVSDDDVLRALTAAVREIGRPVSGKDVRRQLGSDEPDQRVMPALSYRLVRLRNGGRVQSAEADSGRVWWPAPDCAEREFGES